MSKIVKMGSGRVKTDISVEIWKSKIFMITILPLYKEVKIVYTFFSEESKGMISFIRSVSA
ncbi:hypothetical protein O3M35_002530 [Rhynocoris fuscipes]|uniref:Uncharacterized protein n=1 Tax=Rhynocoris fuscipes TaxID=488301 RepID=A0AAW1CLU9_9HEMI